MPHRYPDDQTKITAATSLLSGKATNFLRPYAESTSVPLFLTNWDAFEKEFRSQFFDPDLVSSMTQSLAKLKQTGSAQEYANQFRNIVAYLDMSHQTKRQRFFSGLKPRVQERILAPLDTTLFPSFDILVEQAIRYDNLLHYHFSNTSSSASTTSRSSSRSTPSAAPSTHSRPSAPVHEPMDIDQVRSLPKTKSERDKVRAHRIANKLCLCCGSPDHMISGCPHATRYQAATASGSTSSTSSPRPPKPAKVTNVASGSAPPPPAPSGNSSTQQ
jgi:hypothetical protein